MSSIDELPSESNHIYNEKNKAQSWYFFHSKSITKSHLNQISFAQNNSEDFLALKSDADIGIISAQLEVAVWYELGKGTSKSFSKALNYYKLAAKQGNEEALMYLAFLHEEGVGVKQSIDEALRYYKIAAANGSSSAQIELGMYFENIQKDENQAFFYYQMAANQGDVLGLNFLAKAYNDGMGVTRSKENSQLCYKKIFNILKPLADNGSGEAQARLGELYEWGYGIEQSDESALSYYLLSADQNNLQGEYYLAKFLTKTQGIKAADQIIDCYQHVIQQTNDEFSKCDLGVFLIDNQLDIEKGISILKELADANIVNANTLASYIKQTNASIAQYYLANYFEKGKSVPKCNDKAFHYYMLSARNHLAKAQYVLGIAYKDGKRLSLELSDDKAFYFLKLAADGGDVYAQEELAEMYSHGKGVSKSDELASYYLHLAADNGATYAQMQLAVIYQLVEKSPVKAFYYYQMLANHGNLTGLKYVAKAYEYGLGVEKSSENSEFYYKRIFSHFKHLADEGDSEAQTEVGHFYLDGKIIEKSMNNALYYFRLAADQNHPLGMHYLANCLSMLDGKKYADQITHYYQLAIEKGDEKDVSKYELAVFLIQERIDEKKGISILKELADQSMDFSKTALALCQQGHQSIAQYRLALYYEKGIGVPPNIENAIHYYKLAAKNGLNEAHYMLGLVYERTDCKKNNMVLAFQHFKLAADSGLASAQAKVGECFELGRGVKRSLFLALHYYRLGVIQNNSKAQYFLASYLAGTKGTKARSLAIHYYQLAMIQNEIWAKYELGCFFLNQKIDSDKGLRLLKSIADEDHNTIVTPKALYKLGEIYSCGLIEDENYLDISNFYFKKHFDYYQRLADCGNIDAQVKVAQMFSEGKGVKSSLYKAFEYYKKAADQNSTMALWNVAVLYDSGLGTDQSDSEAFRYYKMAADRGAIDAQLQVAARFEEGLGVGKSLEQAFIYYKKAADQGNWVAQWNVAVSYEKGEGVEQSDLLANHYFHLLSENNKAQEIHSSNEALGC